MLVVDPDGSDRPGQSGEPFIEVAVRIAGDVAPSGELAKKLHAVVKGLVDEPVRLRIAYD